MSDIPDVQVLTGGRKEKGVRNVSDATRALQVRRQSGFSLLEILVVLAIMALIAALIAPRLFNQVDRSKQTVAATQVRALVTALDTMRLDIGRYPSEQEGLQLLLSPPSSGQQTQNWYGPYIEEVPLDPWGAAYRYATPLRDQSGFETSPFVFSFGADQQPGGSGLDSDIGKIPAALVS